MSLNYCPKCGKKLEKNSQFCYSCGVDIRTQVNISEIAPSQVIPIQKIQIPEKKPPENVIYADLLPRVVAFIIDVLIIAAIGSSITWFFFPFNFINPWGTGQLMWWQVILIDYLIGFSYFWALESFNNGQTLGKMALKLRTVDANTLQASDPDKIAINSLTKASGLVIIDLIIGVLSNSEDSQKKARISQNYSNTVVIVEK